MVPAHFHDVTHGIKKTNLVKYCRTTLESLLNQSKSGNSSLSRRTYPDN